MTVGRTVQESDKDCCLPLETLSPLSELQIGANDAQQHNPTAEHNAHGWQSRAEGGAQGPQPDAGATVLHSELKHPQPPAASSAEESYSSSETDSEGDASSQDGEEALQPVLQPDPHAHKARASPAVMRPKPATAHSTDLQVRDLRATTWAGL